MRLARLIRLSTAPALAIVAIGVAAPTAGADSVVSANWAGYAVHGTHDHFRQVSGFWREPKLVCPAGKKTYVQIWTGLGGFSPRSIGVAQLGTEGDCLADGTQIASAWYSVQAGVRKSITMPIKPGDVIQAVVSLGRGTATLELANHTTPRLFVQTVADAAMDDSAAGWMVSAKPFCISPTACQPQPLANFRYMQFGLTSTTLSSGHSGPVTDPNWTATKVSIGLHGRRYSQLLHATRSVRVGVAVPSTLAAGGSVFTVNYRTLSVGTSPFL